LRARLPLSVLSLVACAACAPEPPPPALPPPRPTIAPPPAAVVPPPASTPEPAASVAPAPKPPEGPPGKLNVLLLTVDSLRADMPWAGYARDIAPNLSELEKKAVSFARCYSVSSYTAMSFGGLLSGRYPSEIERSGYFFSSYPESVTFFPELLQKAGVRTLAAHAHFYFETKAGFQQGFDVYKMVPGIVEDRKTDRSITSPDHTKLAIEVLSEPGLGEGKPFFAWFHFMDPHDVYHQHDDTKKWGKSSRDKYDSEVEYTDRHLGQLLRFVEKQPWAKNTAIIVTADHGEAFGEHKQYRHGFEIWDTVVHVPLMIVTPGGTARRIETPRSGIDLAPTILELMGAPAEGSFQGKSLVPELYNKPAEAREVIVDLPRTSDNDRRRAMVWGDHKLTAYGDDFRFELYDVVKDPGEKKDLSDVEKERFKELKGRYKERVKGIKDICPKNTAKLKGKEKGRRC
jgi:choline-sulfatase